MDSLKIFKGYGKMDQADDREFRRKTRSRFILLAVAWILLLAIITGVAISVSINKHRTGDSSSSRQSPVSTSSFIKAVCSVTRYPDSCFTSLSSATSNSTAVAADPAALFQLSLSVASRSISNVSSLLSNFDIPVADNRLRAAVRDCKELLDDAVDRLNDSSAIIAAAKPSEKILSASKISDLRTWLSTSITDQETCLDGFEGTNGRFREKLETAMMNSTQFASNSLAIVTRILGIPEKFHFPINRKLLSTMGWRRDLLAGENLLSVAVAKDGSENVKKIPEMTDMVPRRIRSPLVIPVKEWKSKGNAAVDKNKGNVVVIGDGM